MILADYNNNYMYIKDIVEFIERCRTNLLQFITQ